MKKQYLKLWCLMLALILGGASVQAQMKRSDDFRAKYQLKEVVVMSRHNIRSPLTSSGAAHLRVTPHEWFKWTSPSSQLSLRGGVLETEMGQFFRQWVVSEGLLPDNYRPEGEEVLFYANSRQRTFATAKYFSAGFLPFANVEITHKWDEDKMDPMFTPQFTKMSDAYRQQVLAEIAAMNGGPKAWAATVQPALTLMEEVLDMSESTDLDQIRPAYGGNIMAHINTPKHRPQFATVRYKIFSAPQKAEPHGKVVRRSLAPEKLLSKIEVLARTQKSAEKGIEEAEVLVVCGRGVKRPEDIAMLKELAGLLGGEVASTRAVVEAGWLDAKRQIGLSGRTVKPKLIITCGVSGAIQFVAGMSGSETIVAINTDPKASIFKIAHIGLVGDLYQIIPELIARIKAKKEAK